MKTVINRFRNYLGNLIYPQGFKLSLETLEIRDIRVSSFSDGGSIPKEHLDKVQVELFKIVKDNLIWDLRGVRKGKIFETTIYYINKKYFIA